MKKPPEVIPAAVCIVCAALFPARERNERLFGTQVVEDSLECFALVFDVMGSETLADVLVDGAAEFNSRQLLLDGAGKIDPTLGFVFDSS